MRRLAVLAAFGVGLAIAAPFLARGGQDEFCNGYNAGYLEGYKWASSSIFEPVVPLCPLMPRKTARDPRDDFEHGREVGYEQGKAAGERRFR